MLCVLVLSLCFRMSFAQQQQVSTAAPLSDVTTSEGRAALLWTSIALAVVTSLLQGLVVSIVSIAEDQNMWTFRFRIARFEHWWWTSISIMLSISFILIVLSFLAGNNNDSVGILALSTATLVAIVRYTLPAWRNRHFIEHRWLAWTGKSRTAIKSGYREMCGDQNHWKKMGNAKANVRMFQPQSDIWGLSFPSPKGLWQDPTALLGVFQENDTRWTYNTSWPIGPCIFDDGIEADAGTVSLLWGEEEGFRRRVSRAVNSMPAGLLASKPLTPDGYNGEGLCLAFGLLGRNKGLRPAQHVFDFDDKMKTERGITRNRSHTRISAELENTSCWSPRPSKVMRSYYAKAINDQFGGLPSDFQNVGTEMALLFLDVPVKLLQLWFRHNLDQQSLDLNKRMSGRPIPPVSRPRATPEQLFTLYRASYTSMVISLNYFAPGHLSHASTVVSEKKHNRLPARPDLICFALLYLADHSVRYVRETKRYVEGPGAKMPVWWEEEWVKVRLELEFGSLNESFKDAAAWLLGLPAFPPELNLENWPQWPEIRFTPVYFG